MFRLRCCSASKTSTTGLCRQKKRMRSEDCCCGPSVTSTVPGHERRHQPRHRAAGREQGLQDPVGGSAHRRAGPRPDRRARRVRGRRRTHRLRQVHHAVAGLRPGGAHRGRGAGRRAAGARHRRQGRLHVPAGRHLPLAHGAGQRHGGPPLPRCAQGGGAGRRPATGWPGSASPPSRTATRTSSPAACASASRSPRPSSTTPRSC